MLGTLDFNGPFPRKGASAPADVLIRTIRLVAAALSGMTSAAHGIGQPAARQLRRRHRRPGPIQSDDALEEAAKDVHTHRAIGDLMGMID